MGSHPRYIGQSGIKALLSARFAHPKLYADEALLLWRATWLDGIQLPLVLDTMRPDCGKPKEQRRSFRIITLRPGKDYRAALATPRQGLTVGYVVYPSEPLTLGLCLYELDRLIEANGSRCPLVVYLPYNHCAVECPGEQYIFEPESP